MKIAIVCYPTFGGSGVVATELGQALAKRGHEIHFIAYKQPARLKVLGSGLYFHEVYVGQYDLFKYQPYELALSSRLYEVVSNYNIEIMHVHYAIPHAYAAYMANQMLQVKGRTVPIITTLHGTDITLVGNQPYYKTAVTFSINNSDVVTSVSESLKKDSLTFFDITNEIVVVPNFVDPAQQPVKKDSGMRNKITDNDNQKIITHISNFRPLKRTMDVIKIFEGIQKKMPAKLIMLGDGPEKEKVQMYCQSKQLEQSVMFLGSSNWVSEVLFCTDLFLLPSAQESFGLSALEAFLHKVPVISSNAGGLPELNKNGYSGFLCEVGAIEDFVAKSIYLLQDEKIHQRFSRQAFETAKKFDIRTSLVQYESIYNNTLQRYKKPKK